MPTIQQWLSAYGERHQNEINKTIHWICVPTIFFSMLGFYLAINFPFQLQVCK